MKSIGETLYLPFLALKVFLFNYLEERKVKRLFYSNPEFKIVDEFLKKQSQNPYKVAKEFSEKNKEEDLYTYGETPLTTLHAILSFCGLSEKDYFIDLGSGQGRGVFLASILFHCKAIGIEQIPTFSLTAQKAASLLKNPPSFFLGDMRSYPLEKASLIYFNALCLPDDVFFSMITKLNTLDPGVLVITIGFPLSDYSSCFESLPCQMLPFPWGKSLYYKNKKN